MPLLELYGKKPDGAIDKRVIAGMTGWIIFFPTDAPPDGTLVCNGAELSIAATTGIEGYSLQAMWCATGDFRGAFTEVSTSPAYATQLSTSLVRNRNGISLDASRVVPTADENRPKAIALLACIVYI